MRSSSLRSSSTASPGSRSRSKSPPTSGARPKSRPRARGAARLVAPIAAACALATAAGCAAQKDRASWLEGTILADNLAQLEREPDLVAGKLAKMARNPYRFFRGTAAQFLRDAADDPRWAQPTRFSTPASALVLLVGDPHPENIGTYEIGGELGADWNDFDGACYGPFHLDLRRLAIGFAVLSRMAAPGDDALPRDAARAVATGYAGEIATLTRGDPPLSLRAGQSRIVDDILDRAAERGAARQELDRYTVVRHGVRTLIYGDLKPPDGPVISERLDRLGDRDRRLVRDLLEAYPATLAGAAPPAGEFAIKAMARELGTGVASYALYRYLVLVEGPTSSLQDDRLLELKEVTGCDTFAGAPVLPERRYDSDAERLVDAARALQETRTNDPLLGWARSGRLSVRVVEVTDYQQQIDVDRIAEKTAGGDFSRDDLVELAALAGRLLARAHGLADTAAGERGVEVIADAIGGDADRLADETADYAVGYAGQVEADYQLLVELLQRDGPLLGWRQRQ